MNSSRPFYRWALALLLASCRLASAVDLVAYTEESPPYQYTDNGKVAGIAVDLLRAACGQAKLSCSIEMLPWARAYMLGKLRPNTMLFSLVRRPDRERDFIWVSPISSEPMWIYGRPDSPPVSTLAELSKLRVGVVNGSSGMVFLEQAGVPRAAMDLANGSEANFRKFAAHRVDFIIGTDERYLSQQQRYKLPFKLVKVLKVADATTYYAMNLQSDPALVRTLQTALEQLRHDKVLEQIEEQYRAKAGQ